MRFRPFEAEIRQLLLKHDPRHVSKYCIFVCVYVYICVLAKHLDLTSDHTYIDIYNKHSQLHLVDGWLQQHRWNPRKLYKARRLPPFLPVFSL